MAIFGLISILNQSPRLKKIGGIVIDGYLEESHSRRSTITRLPVEEGADISDHVKNNPDSVTINGKITNTPLLSSILKGVPFLVADRVSDVFQSLEELRIEREPLEVVTSLKIYKNMYIQDFTPVKNQSTGKSMDFTISLVHIEVVKNQTVLIPNEIIGGSELDSLQAQNNVSQGQTVGASGASGSAVSSGSSSILSDVAAQLGAL